MVLDGLRRDGPKWIDADGPAGRERRRAIAATFALEAARASLDARWERSRGLIDWGADLLAKAPPSDAERIWQLAALALCEGARDVVTIDAQLTRMQRRFPGEPRILLGRAFITEVQFWDDDWAYWGKADSARAARPLQAAMASAANRDEAQLRLAYFMLYAGRPTDALDALRQISSSTDEGAAYLAGLFEGWAHERLGRPYDAIRAFRGALAAAPEARAATLHLAVMLAAAGGHEESDRVIGAVLDGRVDVAPDPWTIYGYGDLRRFPLLVSQLRRSFE